MRFASFFAGIGGFDLGLEQAGMQPVFMCEKNPFCQKVLARHWPEVRLMGDINEVQVQDVPDAELWCGGFPCQDLSLANQGKRRGLEGDRSGLFFRFAELLDGARPGWVIIENVPGLLNSADGRDFEVVLKTLDELGYGVSWRVLDAKHFGTPQRRRRVYVVASYRSLRSAAVLFEPGATTIAARSGLGKRDLHARGPVGLDPSSTLYSIQHAGIGRRHTAGPQAKGYRSDGETYTLDSRGSSDAVCKTDAPFRVRDAAGLSPRLDGNRYRSIGNAVAVPVISWLGARIIEASE